MARRICKGMGLSVDNLGRLEKIMFGVAYFDDALWLRVKRVMFQFWTTTCVNVPRCINTANIMALDGDKKHKDVLERCAEVISTHMHDTLFAVRIKNTKTALMYSIWPIDTPLSQLEPPYTALLRIADRMVVIQDLEHFIEQYGPYNVQEI